MARLNRATEWSKRLAKSEHSLRLIFTASFLESTVVPIPLEVVLIPYMLANRHRVWLIATLTTAGCLLGALVGYGIGFFLFESLGRWIIETMNYQTAFNTFQNYFQEHGFWAIVAVGVTPIPFQVAMLLAGTASYPIFLFLLASGIARGIRYYGLALLVVLVGERTVTLWKEHSTTASVLLLLIAIGVIVIQFVG